MLSCRYNFHYLTGIKAGLNFELLPLVNGFMKTIVKPKYYAEFEASRRVLRVRA